MRRLAELLSRHRRRVARVVLVVAVLVVGLELWPSFPRDTELEYALGPGHGRIVELRVAYIQDGEEVHGVSFRWDAGAPEAVRHSIKLPAGEFQLRCELRERGGDSRAVQRTLTTPAEGVVRIHLFERQAAAPHVRVEERSDDLAGWGAWMDTHPPLAGWGEGSRAPSPGRAEGPTGRQS